MVVRYGASVWANIVINSPFLNQMSECLVSNEGAEGSAIILRAGSTLRVYNSKIGGGSVSGLCLIGSNLIAAYTKVSGRESGSGIDRIYIRVLSIRLCQHPYVLHPSTCNLLIHFVCHPTLVFPVH